MSKANRYLTLVAAGLFLLSVFVYTQSLRQADRFQRGQLFLPNLNPDEVAGIVVGKGGDTVTLHRQGDRFLVVEKNDYPASNSAVNRLLRSLLEIGLERKVGSGEEIERELGIEPPTDETIEVTLAGDGGDEMVRFRVGKSSEDGPGNFVERLDDDSDTVYLTSAGVFPATGVDSYLDKQIIDHDRSEVTRVRGTDFTLTRSAEGGDLVLDEMPAGKSLDPSAVSRLESILSGLRFDDVFVADAPEVAGLVFDNSLEVALEDGSGYVLESATRDGKHYLRIRGRSDVQQVAISVDESEEDLKQKAEMLTRADEIDAFNSFHGSWIYQISDFTAEKLQLTRDDLFKVEND